MFFHSCRIIGKARTRGIEHSLPREWTPVLDVHPTAFRPDALPGYAWLQFPERVREVRRQLLEFWYEPPGCALTDEELALLRRLAEADGPMMFQARGAPCRPSSRSIIGLMCCAICGRRGGSCSRCGRRRGGSGACAPAIHGNTSEVHSLWARGARTDGWLVR